jgi:hypothetical protein
MTLAIAYWVCMLLWLCLGVWQNWGTPRAAGGSILLFVLLVLIGWQVFGSPIVRQ